MSPTHGGFEKPMLTEHFTSKNKIEFEKIQYIEYKFHFILTIISIFITVLIGLFFHNKNYETELYVAPLWRALFIFTILLSILVGLRFLRGFYEKNLRRRWWNMGKPQVTDPPDWEGILDMLCNEACDAMELEENGKYPDNLGQFSIEKSLIIPTYIGAIIIGIMYGIVIDYIIFPRIPALFIKDMTVEKLAGLSSNLTAFLALIAAAVSVIFTYQQLRAKVRASSRQKWVNKVRSLLAGVLENIYEISSTGKLHHQFDSFNQCRTHLELHLNPAEKDHRLLMLLIRACAFPEVRITHDQYTAKKIYDTMEKWRLERGIPDGSAPYSVFLNLITMYNEPQNNNSLTFILNNRDQIISYIFKLSHSILKREWERVRHTR